MKSLFSTTNTSLKITRIFAISPEEMWQLWTEPSKISQWHKPNSKTYTTVAEVDARVGGAFRFSMAQTVGVHTAHGVFKELDPPHKLKYSWQWEGDPTNELSEVTVLFDPVPEGTKLTLVHDRLSGPASVKAHGDAWLGSMENINKFSK